MSALCHFPWAADLLHTCCLMPFLCTACSALHPNRLSDSTIDVPHVSDQHGAGDTSGLPRRGTDGKPSTFNSAAAAGIAAAALVPGAVAAGAVAASRSTGSHSKGVDREIEAAPMDSSAAGSDASAPASDTGMRRSRSGVRLGPAGVEVPDAEGAALASVGASAGASSSSNRPPWRPPSSHYDVPAMAPAEHFPRSHNPEAPTKVLQRATAAGGAVTAVGAAGVTAAAVAAGGARQRRASGASDLPPTPTSRGGGEEYLDANEESDPEYPSPRSFYSVEAGGGGASEASFKSAQSKGQGSDAGQCVCQQL